MKLRFSTPVIAAIAALLLLASCSSKKNVQGKMIPKEAGFVLHINSKSIFEKLNVAELKQTDWYKQMMEHVNKDSTVPEFVKRLHENLGSSGIDSAADIILFAQKDSQGRMDVVLEGGLRDAKAFESFLKNIYPQGSAVKDGEIQSMPIMDHAILTWNKDKFIMGMIPPQMSNMYGKPRYQDDTTTLTKESMLLDITAYCKNLYTLKEDNSLGSDEKFTDLMNTEGDLHAWVSVDNLVGSTDLPMGMLSMIKLDAFTKGNIATYTASFDKGKITMKMKNYMGKELSALFKKYSGGSINTDMIKNIPSDNVVGVFAFHFKPEGIKAMVALTGAEGIVDLMLVRQGFSVDDFVKANKGDLLLVVSDLKMKKDSLNIDVPGKKNSPYVYSKPDMKVLFSAAIKDKDAFNKLIAVGKQMGGNEESIHYKTNANYFAIGNDANMVDQYLSGGNHNQPFLDKISGSAVGGFADIQKILNAMPPEAGKDTIATQMWNESVKMWDNAVMTGGDYTGGGYNQQFELNLMDKNTNSLKQLFQYIMTMSALEEKQTKKREAEWKLEPHATIDSTMIDRPMHHTVRKTTGYKKN